MASCTAGLWCRDSCGWWQWEGKRPVVGSCIQLALGLPYPGAREKGAAGGGGPGRQGEEQPCAGTGRRCFEPRPVCQAAALTSTSPALPASTSRSGLGCWVLQRILQPGMAGEHRVTSSGPAHPLRGFSQPAAVAAPEGIPQGMQHPVHVAAGRVAAHEANAQDLEGEGRGSPCRAQLCGHAPVPSPCELSAEQGARVEQPCSAAGREMPVPNSLLTPI